MCSTLKKYRTCRNEECGIEGSVLGGRKRGGNFPEGKYVKRNGHPAPTGSALLPSGLQEDDGNVEMRDVPEKPQVRHTPYAIRHTHRRWKWHKGDPAHTPVWKDTKPQEREMEQDTQGGTTRRWFKITVPCGGKYGKRWLLNSIQSCCPVPFTPVDFHYDKNRARFFVQDASTASALKNITYKICDEESRRIPIFVGPSCVPYSVQNRFTPEQMEQLKLTMKKRYDVSQQALNLHKLRFDPDLMDRDIDMILNRRNCMVATLQIIERNFPELMSLNLCNNKLYQLDGLSDVVEKAPHIKILNLAKNELKSAWELHKVKGLKLEELWLEGNPLCSTFPEKTAYVSAIQDCFPQLLRLDGQELSPTTVIDIDAPELVKSYQESYKESEILKNLVQRFLQEYFLIYDSGDRQGLLGAYHDEACFSLAIPINPRDPDPSSLSAYVKHSRNVQKLKDPHVRRQLLRRTSRDVVHALCLLPRTRHDFRSFVVDMWSHTETMVCFSVNGVFKEVEGKCPGSVRAFTRTFIATTGRSPNLCVVNDQLSVRDASHEELQSAFSIPSPMSCSSSEPTLSQEQCQMVQAFSTQSGMKPQWSHKCLEDNEWNYARAAQIFTTLQTQGKIPEEAFEQMP